jgi:hypothetical protein
MRSFRLSRRLLRFADSFASLACLPIRGVRILTAENENKLAPRQRGGWGCAVYPALLLAGFIWFMQYSQKNPIDPCSDELGALSAAREFVTQRLKAPSTASFAAYDGKLVRVEKLAGCRFQVFGQFDAENGFGAMLRGNYAAIVKVASGGGFSLESIEIR